MRLKWARTVFEPGQAHLSPKPPIFESRHMHEHSVSAPTLRPRLMTKLPINYTFQTQQQYYMGKDSPGNEFKQDVNN